jgi:cysteine desulfurase family protein (TIGR01976 family)
MPPFDPSGLRSEFPALAREQDGRPVVFLDGPGGTQVPQRVIDAVSGYYRTMNANHEGAFATSVESDAMAAEAHAAVADFLGAASPEEIKFGANMTSLTFHVSRSITATFRPGDEIVVTRLDHEANIGPWQTAAADRGLVIRTVDIRDEDCTLDLAGLDAALGPRTRLVAFGYASNAVGTINPVAEIVRRAHAAGALAFVDAVHYAPHGSIDVRALDTDFLVTSAYKWFGPHQGILYGRRAVLDSLPAYKVRPAHDHFETGTAAFELLAGTLAAVDYVADVGRRFGDETGLRAGASDGSADAASGSSERRRHVVAGMTAIHAYECGLAERMLHGLLTIPGLRTWGIADVARIAERTPTFAVTFDRTNPLDAARALAAEGIYAWDGHFYAQSLIERLGLAEHGGVLRLGLVHYSTAAEVDRTLDALARIARGTAAGA